MYVKVLHLDIKGVDVFFTLNEENGEVSGFPLKIYREKFVFPGHPFDASEMLYWHADSWSDLPTNVHTMYHELFCTNMGHTSTKTSIIMAFNTLWDIAGCCRTKVKRVLAVAVGNDTRRYIIETSSFICLLRDEYDFNNSYLDISEAAPLIKLDFPCYPAVPTAILYLLRLTFGMQYEEKKTFDNFNLAYTYAENHQEVAKMNDTSKRTPYKAIMLFETINDANTYEGPVFLYSSAGIRRLTFNEYLDKVQAEHSAPYQLVKVWKSDLSDMDKAHYDALRVSTYPAKNGNKLGTIYMCFRALWYAATKELMSTTAWEEKNA